MGAKRGSLAWIISARRMLSDFFLVQSDQVVQRNALGGNLERSRCEGFTRAGREEADKSLSLLIRLCANCVSNPEISVNRQLRIMSSRI